MHETAGNPPLLSIVCPNWNGSTEDLTIFLTSIKNSRYPKSKLETIIVDNGSTNGCVLFIKKTFPWVKIIELDKNYGFSKAVNVGTKAARGYYIFATNNDIELDGDCLKNLVQHLLEKPLTGVIGGKVLDMKRRKTVISAALHYSYLTGRFNFAKETNATQSCDWVAGCGFCFPKKVWKKVKGLDEDFFFGGEELDFCLRVKYAGFAVIYHPEAKVWHKSSSTVNRKEYADFFLEQINKSKVRNILKHSTLPEIICALFLQIFIFSPVKKFFYGEKGSIALIKALVWHYHHMPVNISAQRR